MSLPTSATKVRRHGSAIRRSGWRRAIRDLLVVVLLTVGGIAGYFWWDEWPIREIEAALRRRDYSQALNLSNSFVRDHPDSVAAVELKARALTGMQRWSEASRLFERVGARTPAGESSEPTRSATVRRVWPAETDRIHPSQISVGVGTIIWSESRMREIRPSGSMSGDVEPEHGWIL